MNNSFTRRVALLGAVMFVLATAIVATAQTTRQRPAVVTNDTASYRYAYQHAYRAGYEDGFVKGKSDVNENLSRDFETSDAYNRADRTYKESMGTLAEYQEGYRVGFEFGYNDGYFGRPYSVSLPANLGKIVIATVNSSNNADSSSRPRTAEDSRTVADNRGADKRASEPAERTRDRASSNSSSSGSSRRGAVIVRDGVEMKVRLNDQISTKINKEGDKFTAVVLDPSDYVDAVVEGHISKLNKSGKATGKTELSLVFDAIHMRDGRSGRFAAQVEKIYQSEKVKTVDDEGNVESSSRTKDTAVRTGGGAVLGAIIGGVAGGGKGAAIGAAIGAGVGAGSVFIEGGKELTLEPGTEILIRSAAPASSKDQ